jgi:hypothetical protein
MYRSAMLGLGVLGALALFGCSKDERRASAQGGSANAAGGSAAGGGAGGATSAAFVYWVAQSNGMITADLANGTFSVSGVYSASGNAFKYVEPNYYGTSSNGFIALPTPMQGDFSMSAEVTVTAQNKANNACGIGLGMTTGFAPTDAYAYVLMRNASNSTNGYYVSGAGTLASGAPMVPFTNGTPLLLSFSRAGDKVRFGAGPVGDVPTTQEVALSALGDGTTNYGAGDVYPAISFNNVTATITKLSIEDASGAVVYDSDTGALVKYVPASLTLSQVAVAMKKGASLQVLATAVAVGGEVSRVTAQAADASIVDVSVMNGAASSAIHLTGLKGGATTVTVMNANDANPATNTKTFTVAVNDYATSDAYGALADVAYPAPGATSAYTDGELALTFDAAPTLNLGGSIQIYEASDGTEVDNIKFSGESYVLAGTPIAVGSELVRVDGNTVYFKPHPGRLAYGTGYYVVIPTTAISGKLNGKEFTGLSDLSTVASWNFTTRAAPALDAKNITVDGAQTGRADFRTLQGALSAVQSGFADTADVRINVAAGTYRELLRFVGSANAAQTIRISGPSGNAQGDDCVVQWANGNGMNGSTQTRAAFYFSGANLVLENISFKNTAARATVGQAEALYFAGGANGTHLAAYNSSFYSNQDTLQTSGRNWFYKCHIEGNVDFIWGTADAALFESCDMRFVNDVGGAASYSLVVARTGATIAAGASGTVGKGYVLLKSTVNVDPNVTAYFGRDAGTGAYYDQVALVNVAFTGQGSVGAGLWNTATPPLSMGDASYVGWKSTGISGLNTASLATASGTSTTIADGAYEYDTRDHILNRVVTVTGGAPSGYENVATPWDVGALATAWQAP